MIRKSIVMFGIFSVILLVIAGYSSTALAKPRLNISTTEDSQTPPLLSKYLLLRYTLREMRAIFWWKLSPEMELFGNIELSLTLLRCMTIMYSTIVWVMIWDFVLHLIGWELPFQNPWYSFD